MATKWLTNLDVCISGTFLLESLHFHLGDLLGYKFINLAYNRVKNTKHGVASVLLVTFLNISQVTYPDNFIEFLTRP
jgi:hypothetical protein